MSAKKANCASAKIGDQGRSVRDFGELQPITPGYSAATRSENLARAVQQPVATGNQERPDEYGVHRDSDDQGEAELPERAQRAEQERREAARRDRRGRADQSTGLTDRTHDPASEPMPGRLLLQPGHEEDVVVDPDGDQKHKQEVGNLPV